MSLPPMPARGAPNSPRSHVFCPLNASGITPAAFSLSSAGNSSAQVVGWATPALSSAALEKKNQFWPWMSTGTA